ncbi:MAG TPA: anti-sigma factor antagonist [Planctomycetes bacterium]|nr:anti-sigma factor antagonist [Planctomycetota bacterium]
MRRFELKDGTLLVVDDLYWDAEEDFQKVVDELLRSPQQTLVIDLSRVNFIFSPFVGHIVRFCMVARETGKTPRIIVNRQIEALFASSGLAAELPITTAVSS